MHRSAVTLVPLLALAILCGCPGDDTGFDAGSECGRGPGIVELAQGGSRLRNLADGADLPIVRGSQGGIHVLLGFRVRDMELTMNAVYQLRDSETGELVGTPTERALRPTLFSTEGTDTVRNPDLVVLDNGSDDTTDFDGRAVRVELSAVSAGSHACDAREVILRAPE